MDNVDLSSSSTWPRLDSANVRPKITPAMTIVTPMADASATLPGRILYIHNPVSSAAGIVSRIVNIPHGLSANAFTTTNPILASVQIRMNNVATELVTPATGPIFFRAICGNDSPSWRTDAQRITRSWTAPARQAPITIQINPGAYPHCAARTGPTNGPGPAIAAK